MILKLFKKFMPREDQFFPMFERHSVHIVEASLALRTLLDGGARAQGAGAEVLQAERAADEVTREVMTAVRLSFIHPFDRTDIKDLIESMDDSVDSMKKFVKAADLYGRPADATMREMGDRIVDASRLVAQAVPLLDRIAENAPRLAELCDEISRLESETDRLHDEGLKEAWAVASREGGALGFVAAKELYGLLEKVADSLEDVADEISAIVIAQV